MSKRRSMLALTMMATGLLLLTAAPLMAQEHGEDAAGATMEAQATGAAWLLDAKGAGKLGGAIGAGLVLMGGGAGIARIGGSAVESMARQPEVASGISTAMIITAAMIEGATLFGVVVCLLAAL